MAEPVTIKLLDREFLIACEPDERAGLVAAAGFLDDKMRALRANSKSPGFDRLAVLAALSVTHEFLDLERRTKEREQTVRDGLGTLRRKLERALEAPSETAG